MKPIRLIVRRVCRLLGIARLHNANGSHSWRRVTWVNDALFVNRFDIADGAPWIVSIACGGGLGGYACDDKERAILAARRFWSLLPCDMQANLAWMNVAQCSALNGRDFREAIQAWKSECDVKLCEVE